MDGREAVLRLLGSNEEILFINDSETQVHYYEYNPDGNDGKGLIYSSVLDLPAIETLIKDPDIDNETLYEKMIDSSKRYVIEADNPGFKETVDFIRMFLPRNIYTADVKADGQLMKVLRKIAGDIVNPLYTVKSYFDSDFRGLDNDLDTSDFDEAYSFAHECLCSGGFVEIENNETGKSLRFDPDTYLHLFNADHVFTAEDLEDFKVPEMPFDLDDGPEV